MRMNHSGKLIVCELCGKHFKHEKYHEEHMKNVHNVCEISHDDKLKKCEMCQKEFDSVSPLESHLKECLDELKAFQCKLCETKWVSHLSLELHYIECHNSLIHACHICGRFYKQKAELKIHIGMVSHQHLLIRNLSIGGAAVIYLSYCCILCFRTNFCPFLV